MTDWYYQLVVLAVLVALLLWVHWYHQRSINELQHKCREQNKVMLELKSELQLLQEGVHELRTGSLGVGQKVQDLVKQLQETQARQDELKDQDPESKLYGQAARMAQQGATTDEIMQECELPRAEAELLIQLHKK
ncbi:DUF2802 domain-containing protein [Neptunicella sp. SCSIO 80796]|uniref:DUF2802 domain-containing protein n=1 Tax=Neptunicella plasticusilytica TaxID=3117012 RepID=UPI003A4E2AF5